MKSKIWLLLGCAFLIAGQSSIGGTELELSPQLKSGKQRANQICSNCHGLDGQLVQGGNSAISPKITAQQKPYLVARLQKYKSGELQHPQMTLVARMLSDQEIDDISEWYSKIKIDSPWFSEPQGSTGAGGETPDANLSPKAQAGKLKASQVCAGCHGLYGQAISAEGSLVVPNLTAQQKEFLVARLRDYRSGRLKQAMMSQITATLTDQEIENIAEWYSNIEMIITDPDLMQSQ